VSAPSRPPRLAPEAHKGDAGRVLSVAGSETMPGAAVLVARAAQRAGAGLVIAACLDGALLTIVPPCAPEAVLADLTELVERGGRIRPGARELLAARRPHAVVIGPGLGDDARTRAVLALVLAEVDAPLVLDADALNVLEGEPERLLRARAAVRILTPHPGEAARLLGRELAKEASAREDAARELAERSGSIVCLKGRGTVVVAPGGEPWTGTSGNAGMATAGAGDVLAGVLAAYLALTHSLPGSGWTALAAAQAAVHVHGLAGDLAAERLGARALIASDLVDELPAAQRRFEDAEHEGA
jgi:NAD(P)H-hydrate epimerase